MHGGAQNLGYLARGTRTYGLRPVLGRARGVWELQWVLRGRARPDRPANDLTEGKAPCLYLSHPESPHGWMDDGDSSSDVFVIHVRKVPPELAERVKPAGALTVNLRADEHRAFAARLGELWALSAAGDARLGLKLDQALVETALLVLGRSAPVALKPSIADRVELALHWFEENLAENPSVDEVASAVGVSAAHLRRVFSEAGREAPRAELARLRMAAAQRCLREGWKLERVAEFLGFSEASAFSRAFSGVCGASPRKWLAQQHGPVE